MLWSHKPKSPRYYDGLESAARKVLDGLIAAIPNEQNAEIIERASFNAYMGMSGYGGLITSPVTTPLINTMASPTSHYWTLNCRVPFTKAEKPAKDDVLKMLASILQDQCDGLEGCVNPSFPHRKRFVQKPDDAAGVWEFTLHFKTDATPEKILPLLLECRDDIRTCIAHSCKLEKTYLQKDPRPEASLVHCR